MDQINIRAEYEHYVLMVAFSYLELRSRDIFLYNTNNGAGV